MAKLCEHRGRPRKRRWGHIALVWIMIVLTCGVAAVGGKYYRPWEINQQVLAAEASRLKPTTDSLGLANVDNDRLEQYLSAQHYEEPGSTTKAVVRHYIGKYFGDEAPLAERVFTCESNLNPNAVGVNKDGSTDRGVGQINSSNRKTFEKVAGGAYELLAHDIDSNVRYAKWLRDNSRGGWSNWTCFKRIGGK